MHSLNKCLGAIATVAVLATIAASGAQAGDCGVVYSRSYFENRGGRPQPVFSYERYSPAGYPYDWSRTSYFLSPAYGFPCYRPTRTSGYERYSPAGYPYEWSRVDYYAPAPY